MRYRYEAIKCVSNYVLPMQQIHMKLCGTKKLKNITNLFKEDYLWLVMIILVK